MKRTLAIFLAILMTLFLVASCGGGDDDDGGGNGDLSREGESCAKTVDCEEGLRCVQQECVQDESNPDGDTATSGLTWQNPPADSSMEWQDAIDYCNDLSLDGHSDWRLPTISELLSLIRGCSATESDGTCNIDVGDCLEWSCRDDSCDGCSSGEGPANGCYWPDNIEGSCSWYWSSSPVEDYVSTAWGVLFLYGRVRGDHVGYRYDVRCVR